MRILYITESMGWSGGAQQALWMAGALQKRGHEMLLACQPESDLLERCRASRHSDGDGQNASRLRCVRSGHVRRLVARYRPDVLHAQHSTAHAVALMAAWGLRSPVFAVTRRVVFPLGQNIFSRLKYLTKRINGYVAISNAVKENPGAGGVSPARVEVIPSVTDEPGDSPPNQQSLFGELGLTAGRPLITNVANYADFKGQNYLLEAAAEVVKRFRRFKSCSWGGKRRKCGRSFKG